MVFFIYILKKLNVTIGSEKSQCSPVFVISSQFGPNFFKTESILSLYQIYFLYKFYNGIIIMIGIFNKIKFI